MSLAARIERLKVSEEFIRKKLKFGKYPLYQATDEVMAEFGVRRETAEDYINTIRHKVKNDNYNFLPDRVSQ